MKTMGLGRLVMVNPKKFPHYEASKRAAGAENVLDSAELVSDVGRAISDCTLVLGTSVREREVSWPTYDPRQSAATVVDHVANEPEHREVAILFGRESSGLSNSEMDLCQSQIRIPANDEYSSLNLASAVQIIAYELRMTALAMGGLVDSSEIQTPAEQALPTAIEQRRFAATHVQREGHIQHLQKTLESLDFIKNKPPTLLLRKLTRLYNKADLTVEEIQILRGILSAVDSTLE